MSGWQETYDTGVFKITTDQPSRVVNEYAKLIPQNTRVADLGCGAGRNAIFLANNGHTVDAFDLVDLKWHEDLAEPTASRINFQQSNVEDVQLAVRTYGAVLMMRLIQYLPIDQVEKLIAKSTDSLLPRGLLLLNYSVFGGGHDIPELDVEKYSHPPEVITDLVKNNELNIINFSESDMPPQHVNLNSGTVHACDLVAQKL